MSLREMSFRDEMTVNEREGEARSEREREGEAQLIF